MIPAPRGNMLTVMFVFRDSGQLSKKYTTSVLKLLVKTNLNELQTTILACNLEADAFALR